MENSLTSMSKDCSSGTKTDNSPEESSWTFYFEDFLCNYDEPASYSSDNECPSLISDAASSSVAVAAAAVKKVMGDNNLGLGFALGRSYSKSLSFKKRKTGAIVDDAFEDTASSPVNSPKVSYFSQVEQRRKDKEHTDISEEKVGACGQADGRGDVGIDGGDRDYTELKKRGLCLVPVSTLANYLR